ncbi:MAG TPA: hypothetical protein DCS93_15890 [Microscillaceae bacterium]|nr:hypothetical protein [Microscillaceae bacterium]
MLSYTLEKATLIEKLDQIAQLISASHQNETLIGVLNGTSGMALFQFYYAKYLNSESPTDLGEEIIANCIESINEGFGLPTFCNGIAGLGWTMDHLQQEDFIEIDNDEILANLDDYLYTQMKADFALNNYDFLHGAIGYGFYFLKRWKNTQDTDLKAQYHTYLLELVSFLKETSEEKPEGTTWKSIVIQETKQEGYNLSLSHGMSSVVSFLNLLYAIDDFKALVEPLLRGAVDYILFYRNKQQEGLSLFPSWINPGQDPLYKSRLAWCYGDLGIGLTLWKVAKNLQDSTLADTALDIYTHASQRKDPMDTAVTDAGVCHGSFGIAKMFDKMYQETQNPLFKETAEFWLREALQMDVHPDGLAGYKKFYPKDTNEQWKNDFCLLEGITGIGLTLIDFLSETPNNWDECLLIS